MCGLHFIYFFGIHDNMNVGQKSIICVRKTELSCVFTWQTTLLMLALTRIDWTFLRLLYLNSVEIISFNKILMMCVYEEYIDDILTTSSNCATLSILLKQRDHFIFMVGSVGVRSEVSVQAP